MTGVWADPGAAGPAPRPAHQPAQRRGEGASASAWSSSAGRAGIEPVVLEPGPICVGLVEKAVADGGGRRRHGRAATAPRARSRAWPPGTGSPWWSCRRARGTTWPWTSGSTGGTSMRRAGRVRRRPPRGGSTSGRSTAGCSSTTRRWGSTPRSSARPRTARRRWRRPSSTLARPARAGQPAVRPALHRPGGGAVHRRARRAGLEQPVRPPPASISQPAASRRRAARGAGARAGRSGGGEGVPCGGRGQAGRAAPGRAHLGGTRVRGGCGRPARPGHRRGGRAMAPPCGSPSVRVRCGCACHRTPRDCRPPPGNTSGGPLRPGCSPGPPPAAAAPRADPTGAEPPQPPPAMAAPQTAATTTSTSGTATRDAGS